MEVLEDEYEKIARFLKTEYEWGKNWVVYEEGALIRSPSELHTFSREQDARQYAHDNTSDFDFMNTATIKNSLFTIKTKYMNAQNLEFLGSNLKY
ncbi:MAG: hypothetical protein JWQ25_1453, partial [Daejeonella sp.]|nr:hypothetical protein [Daejeonella sp.]